MGLLSTDKTLEEQLIEANFKKYMHLTNRGQTMKEVTFWETSFYMDIGYRIAPFKVIYYPPEYKGPRPSLFKSEDVAGSIAFLCYAVGGFSEIYKINVENIQDIYACIEVYKTSHFIEDSGYKRELK